MPGLWPPLHRLHSLSSLPVIRPMTVVLSAKLALWVTTQSCVNREYKRGLRAPVLRVRVEDVVGQSAQPGVCLSGNSGSCHTGWCWALGLWVWWWAWRAQWYWMLSYSQWTAFSHMCSSGPGGRGQCEGLGRWHRLYIYLVRMQMEVGPVSLSICPGYYKWVGVLGLLYLFNWEVDHKTCTEGVQFIWERCRHCLSTALLLYSVMVLSPDHMFLELEPW